MNKKKVAIIGGGMTGLAAAFKLEQAKSKDVPIEYDLYEKADRLGGKIETIRKDGFVIERGPDSFLARKTSMIRLAEDVGIGDELIANDTGQSFVLKGTKLHPIPKGAFMGIPLEMQPFWESKLISTKGKIRALADFYLPKVSAEDEDISLGHFFRHRFGDEIVDHLMEPLLSGIYAGDLDKLSLQATFPNFIQVEKKYGSLIRGMKAALGKQSRPTNAEKPQGIFRTFQRGLTSLVEAIEEKLDKEAIHKNTGIRKIEKEENGYILTFEDGETKKYDELIVTTPPHVTANLFNDYSYFRYLEEMEATSVANVAIAFKEEAVHYPYDGTGFVVPTKSDFTITACTWTNKKWRHSTPEGYALLRLYVGKPNASAIVHESDEAIVEMALSDLRKIMKIDGEPEFSYVTRWIKAMPQYNVGHTYRIAKLKEDVARHLPGVHVCGAAYEGIGLPDCIDQGERAAEAVLQINE